MDRHNFFMWNLIPIRSVWLGFYMNRLAIFNKAHYTWVVQRISLIKVWPCLNMKASQWLYCSFVSLVSTKSKIRYEQNMIMIFFYHLNEDLEKCIKSSLGRWRRCSKDLRKTFLFYVSNKKLLLEALLDMISFLWSFLAGK